MTCVVSGHRATDGETLDELVAAGSRLTAPWHAAPKARLAEPWHTARGTGGAIGTQGAARRAVARGAGHGQSQWHPRHGSQSRGTRHAAWLAALVLAAWLGPLVDSVEAQSGGPPPALVRLAPVVERQDLRAGQAFVGTVEPLRRSVVGSAVDGRVVEFAVNAGDTVQKGQPLAQLLTETIGIEIRVARAELALRQQELLELKNGTRPEELREAEARMLAAQALRDYAQSKLRRTQTLYDRKATTEDELHDAVAAAAAAENNAAANRAAYELAQAGPRRERIDQAQARVDMAQEQLNRLLDIEAKYTIRAPFDGEVVAEHTEVGQWISTGQLVAEVVELARVEILIQVPEVYAPHVALGSRVRVEVPALPETLFEGEVAAIINQADERSRTFPVRVRVENDRTGPAGRLLKAGMFARVWLPVAEKARVLLVPKDAVVLGGPTPLVYVPQGDASRPGGAVAAAVPVGLGVQDEALIEVTGPLQPGQMVVVDGNERLFPGQPLVVDAPRGPAASAAGAAAAPAAGTAPAEPDSPSDAAARRE